MSPEKFTRAMMETERVLTGQVLQFGPLRIIPEEFIATLDGEPLPLSFKEFQLLVLLARNAGRIVRREKMAAEIWNGRPLGRTMDVHMARLRARLPSGSIQTVVRVGYRFVLGTEPT